MKQSSISRIAIIGRPNVGKSTLFNRIVGRRHSITEKKSGTTRDRVSALVKKEGYSFELVDTGGLDFGRVDHISGMIKRQIEIALESADIILFVCDVTDGITNLDEEILSVLRRSGGDIVLVVNKVDNEKLEENVSEFYSFGIGELYPVSAIHNIGISTLLESIAGRIKPQSIDESPAETGIRVAIVGRPNVGKSSFVNKIINEERVIVHEEPGTTRDSIDIHLKRQNTDYIIVDTAGMRHKRKVHDAVDVYGMLRAKESIDRSDISLIMIDAYDGLTRDDMSILSSVEEAGKGSFLIVNKWDLISGFEMAKYQDALVRKMKYLRGIPVLFTSCKTGLNLEDVFSLISLVFRNITARFPDDEIKRIRQLIEMSDKVPLVRSGKLIKIEGMKQEDGAPPTFEVSVNDPRNVSGDYIECIKNILRNELGLTGVPIRIRIKRKKNKK
ncbi:MAG: ribosome biogenesis GTPase Der [Candidatus Omnitrophica bacterium]|nr:ribosome biogenesis GTPase Der [Candidatus Omnitrophota bacterium]